MLTFGGVILLVTIAPASITAGTLRATTTAHRGEEARNSQLDGVQEPTPITEQAAYASVSEGKQARLAKEGGEKCAPGMYVFF